MTNVNFIASTTRRKRYHKGGRKRACYYPIGGRPEKILFLAEGFATTATVFEATGIPAAACFDAGNLKPVAEELSLNFPKCELIYCADNDVHTKGNPGITKATEAAQAYGGRVFWPTFSDNVDYTDWNDMAVHYGREVVRDNLLGLL